MINPEVFDQPAEMAVERYNSLIASYRDTFFAATAVDPLDIRNRMRLVGHLAYISNKAIESEQAVMTQMLIANRVNAIAQAHLDLGLNKGPETTDLGEYGETIRDSSLTELHTQMTRDALKFVRLWQEFALEYQMRLGRSIPEIAKFQAIETARQKDEVDPSTASLRFARLNHRYALLTFAFETYAKEAFDLGAKYMLVVKNGQAGDRVDFLPGGPGKTFAELRDEVFHPNSTATLLAVV
jgi:hypothetical protein